MQMLISSLRLANADVALLGVPIENAAHTRIIVHVRDHLGTNIEQHGLAFFVLPRLHGKVLLQACTKVKRVKAIIVLLLSKALLNEEK
jgi:hypothetical protein